MIREQIMLTALDLFSQYGIKKVTMNDIACHLGISKRTLYRHFEDKETLLIDGLEYQDNQLVALWNELGKGPCTVLEKILLFFREVMKSPKWYTRKFYEELELYPKVLKERDKKDVKFEKKSLELLKQGVEEEVFVDNVNFGIVVKLAKKHVKMYCPPKSFSKYSNTEVYETLLFSFLRGICTEKGRIILDRWFALRQVCVSG